MTQSPAPTVPARSVRLSNHLFRCIMFHQVSQWNSISKIARPAPVVSQQPFSLPKYPEIPQYEVPPRAFSLIRRYCTGPVGSTHSRHWPDKASKSQVVRSWACDNFWQDDL